MNKLLKTTMQREVPPFQKQAADVEPVLKKFKKSKQQERDMDEDEDSLIVESSTYNKLKEKYDTMVFKFTEKLKEKDDHIADLKERNEALSNALASKVLTVDKWLNTILERQQSSVKNVTIINDHNEDFELQENLKDDCELHTNMKEDSAANLPSNTRNETSRSDDMILIGENVMVPNEQWKLLQHEKDTLFVKNLAVMMWGTEELKKRSVSGKTSNRDKKADAKRPLTPLKVALIKEKLEEKLVREAVPMDEIQRRKMKVNALLAEKIASLNKTSKLMPTKKILHFD